jgi:signal transduction histidine kinase
MRPALRLPGSSVRTRTTLAATAVVTLLLTAAAWVLLLTLEGALTHNQDDASMARARDLAAVVAGGRLPDGLRGVGDDSLAQVVARDGTVLAASANIVGEPPVVPVTDSGPPSDVHTESVRDDGRDLETYRIRGVRVRSPDHGPVTVHVGTSTEAVSETVAALRGLLVVGVPTTALLLGLVTWVVVGRALAPVQAINARVAEITAADLTRRVPEPGTGDEIAQLATTMNAMLERLEDAARRQREFAADASHDLQSPLARFRTRLEVALANPSDSDWRALSEELLSDSQEMERLVRDLLFLARDDEAAAVTRPTSMLDLDDVVLEEASRLRATGPITVDTAAVSAAPVLGHRADLGRMVRNLLENAACHATSRVVVRLAATDGRVELVVADDGPGIPADQRHRVFDRFVRLDDARTRGSGGSGLGLAIVHTVAARHGGHVEVRDGAPGATFVVRLPLPGQSAAGGPG